MLRYLPFLTQLGVDNKDMLGSAESPVLSFFEAGDGGIPLGEVDDKLVTIPRP
jgi:hypothetical protein